MMSGHGTIETAIEATRLGATDFLEKPVSTERLLLSLEHALDLVRLREENRALRDRAGLGEGLLGESAAMQGLRLRLAEPDERAGAQVTIENGEIKVTGGAQLNRFERALLERDLHAMQMAEQMKAAGIEPPAPPPRFSLSIPKPPNEPPEALARFAPVFLLWMTLVGALGMLLQSVVRERANRALEHLLASVRPSEIVFGKLVGVGAVSLLVLGTWLGSGAAIAATPLGAAPTILSGLAGPWQAAYAGGVYVMAFLLYGSALVSIGAFAKDLPSAQNLSRPVFILLLVIFFMAMGTAIRTDDSRIFSTIGRVAARVPASGDRAIPTAYRNSAGKSVMVKTKNATVDSLPRR